MLDKDGFINSLGEFNAARQKHYDTGEVQYIPAIATATKPIGLWSIDIPTTVFPSDSRFSRLAPTVSWNCNWAHLCFLYHFSTGPNPPIFF